MVSPANTGAVSAMNASADSTKGGAIRSQSIKPRPLAHGAVQVVRFSRPGVVYYLCTFHPTLMKGRIVVTR